MGSTDTNRILGEATEHVKEMKSVHFIREIWSPVGHAGKIDVPADMPNDKALDKAFTVFNGMDETMPYTQGPAASVGDTFVIENKGEFQSHKIGRFGFQQVDNDPAIAQARHVRNLEILKPSTPRSPEEEGRMIKALIESHHHEFRDTQSRGR